MFKKVFSLFTLLSLAGCATLFSNKDNTITFESEPAGAKVYIDGLYLGETPVSKRVDPDTFGNKVVSFKKEGYQTQSFELRKSLNTASLWNLGFITTTLGVSSWGTDALSGKMVEYTPKGYVIELKKKADSEEEAGLKPSALEYAVSNYQKLREDLARNSGETLQTYAALRGLRIERLIAKKEALLKTSNGLVFYRTM